MPHPPHYRLLLSLLVAIACGCATVPTGEPVDQPLAKVLATAEQEIASVAVPSNVRPWSPDQSILATANFEGDTVRVNNIRNCTYFDADTYVLKYYDRSIRLADVQTVDFLVMPFTSSPLIAHTMLSFGLADGSYLGVSVEIRKEEGESYNPIYGFFNQYEIMYVIGDERDLIELNTNHRASDVYLYRTRATAAQAQAMLTSILLRANQLRDKPEFYHTLANNCTTNITMHVNALAPGKFSFGWGEVFPGLADRTAYDLGLLDTDLPFELAKKQAYVTKIAQQHADSPDFSQRIRAHLAR